jgi:hypothetical protein
MSDLVTRCPVLLCQIAAAIAGMRWATRMATPSNVRPPWGFEVELALEGVVDRLDQLAY